MSLGISLNLQPQQPLRHVAPHRVRADYQPPTSEELFEGWARSVRLGMEDAAQVCERGRQWTACRLLGHAHKQLGSLSPEGLDPLSSSL